MRERKWWCFLLSSILTFLMGVSGVFVMRVLKFIFCREVRMAFNVREWCEDGEVEEDLYHPDMGCIKHYVCKYIICK